MVEQKFQGKGKAQKFGEPISELNAFILKALSKWLLAGLLTYLTFKAFPQ